MKVDIATLQAMAAQCRGEAGEQAARLATLTAGIGSGVTDGWTDSAAAGEFTRLYEQWRASSQAIGVALSGMGDLLTDVGNAYQQHEAQMAARIGAMV
ncbi:WXG100 family type VII secretion target [Klenkia sp. PcliD-1-E]|uniref:WXG100 family type VII secretion target n=1 Tax=Klenkia sp. PcliD-1-E TaxID=2954492 RepID=UPI00209721ED|nr:WXG100 family type VII secretion target [Klenkia sp. PcliD-1-E]MCO7222158.1 WXG100 family type VII secretion target [Klenkia sp. PcliD-1-E]